VIKNALASAGITPADVDHVNAHGCGSIELDGFEARGIAGAFGTDVPVYTALPAFGSLSAASAVLELAASVLALHHGQLPGTLNHENPDPACPIRVHTGGPKTVTKPYAVKVAYTDLGQCAALVVKKFAE
jgi:3-oxoacyl-[acyl-carrier-protein] synthase II